MSATTDNLDAEIAFEDHLSIRLRLTETTCDALARLNLFLGYQERCMPDPRRVIQIPKSARFGEYTSFLGAFHTIGAFSYSETASLTVEVGRYCSIAAGFATFGERHPIERVTSSGITYCFLTNWHKPQFIRAHRALMGDRYQPDFDGMEKQPVPIIEHDVWICQNVQVALGITIGTGAVVGAGSVVTKSVPPYSIVGGIPARPIRMRFPNDTATRLLNTRWWTYHPEVLWESGYRNPEEFCDKFESASRNGEIAPHTFRELSWRDVVTEIASLQESSRAAATEPRQLLTNFDTVVFGNPAGEPPTWAVNKQPRECFPDQGQTDGSSDVSRTGGAAAN